METKNFLSKFNLDYILSNNSEEITNKNLSNLVDQLCFDRSNKISSNLEKLKVLKTTLEIDKDILQTAYYYQQPAQKQWLDKRVLLIEKAFAESKFKYTQSRLINEQVVEAIKNVAKIYETKNESLIEQFQKIIKNKSDLINKKLNLVQDKINQLIAPKSVAMNEGFSQILGRKDSGGFAIPLSKNTQEKKRELKDQKSDQLSKRRELEKDTQKGKENKPENNESSSVSTHESQNNGYQSN